MGRGGISRLMEQSMNLLSKDPSTMTRAEKVRVIAYLYRTHGMIEAQKFWLRECPRISKRVFMESILCTK